ncbi:MAG: alpha/beta fold hydrolase [Actinomycetes bacterium]
MRPRVRPRARAKDAAVAVLRRAVTIPPVRELPPGRMLDLPGRGRTFVVDCPGPPGAPTLLLLHALACTATLSWYPVLPELSQQYRVVLFDQRWHGRGIRSKRFRLEDCADDAVAVLDALGIDRAIVTGYSMGGSVAQLVWKRHPQRVEGLVLCATARNFRGKRREKLFFPVMSAAMLPLSLYASTRVERLAATLPELPGPVTDDHRVWGRQEFRSTSAWSAPAVLAALGGFNSAPWIGSVDVPTAVVVTTRDHTIPVRRQRRLAAAIPGADVVEVDGGHGALVLQADKFGPAVAAAAAGVVARAGERGPLERSG